MMDLLEVHELDKGVQLVKKCFLKLQNIKIEEIYIGGVKVET